MFPSGTRVEVLEILFIVIDGLVRFGLVEFQYVGIFLSSFSLVGVEQDLHFLSVLSKDLKLD